MDACKRQCIAWLDFSDPSTLYTDAGITNVSADGDLIYRAADKSGNGHHYNQGSSSLRPAYKTGIQNGLSAALFNADRLVATGYGAILADVYLVIKPSTVSDQYGIIGVGNSAYRGLVLFGFGYARYDIGNLGYTANGIATTNTTLVEYNQHLSSGEDGAIRVNGVDKRVGVRSNTLSVDDGYLGTGVTDKWFYGYVMEVVVCNTNLSSADRALLENYLNTKWSIYEPA